jgi:hypothetical protein
MPGRVRRNDPRARTHPSRAAFTLVETFAAGVLGLFALVALTSTAHGTRAASHLSGCLANLRTIGQASRAYAAADPRELLIPVAAHADPTVVPTAFDWGGKAGVGQAPGDITASPFGTGAYRGPAHRPLNAYVYKTALPNYNPVGGTPNPGPGNYNFLRDASLDLDVYHCPADTGYAGGGFLYTAGGRFETNERAFRDEGRTAYDHYGTSYAAVTLWIVGGLSGSALRSQSVFLTPLTQVPDPAHTLAYEEVPARFLWLWGSWSDSGCDWVDYESRVEARFAIVPGWHGQPFHTTATFADGHAALIEMQGCTRPAPNLGLPNYPSGQCGTSVSPYDCQRCLTFRGPGWQQDTLPAPEVATPWTGGKSAGGPRVVEVF